MSCSTFSYHGDLVCLNVVFASGDWCLCFFLVVGFSCVCLFVCFCCRCCGLCGAPLIIAWINFPFCFASSFPCSSPLSSPAIFCFKFPTPDCHPFYKHTHIHTHTYTYTNLSIFNYSTILLCTSNTLLFVFLWIATSSLSFFVAVPLFSLSTSPSFS